MKDTHTPKAPPSPNPPSVDPISPDELMSDFRGHSTVKIVTFTLVLHLIIVAVFSPGYLKRQVFGDTPEPADEITELTSEQRMDKAEKDGDSALREIADRYGITVKELKAQLSAEKPAATATPETSTPQDPAKPDSTEPDSKIEKDLTVEVEGPAVPDLAPDGEEDLFAPKTP